MKKYIQFFGYDVRFADSQPDEVSIYHAYLDYTTTINEVINTCNDAMEYWTNEVGADVIIIPDYITH